MQPREPCSATQRDGGPRGAEWLQTPASSGRDTPLRHASRSSAAARPAWDVELPPAPSARSGTAGTSASTVSLWRASSARPQFDMGSPAGALPGAQQQNGLAVPHAWRGGTRSPPPASEELEPPDERAEREGSVDRQWYDDMEGGGHGEAFNPFAGDDASYAKKETELQKRLTRRDGSVMTLAQSKRASQMHMDHTAWEENRLMTSGIARLREVDMVR